MSECERDSSCAGRIGEAALPCIRWGVLVHCPHTGSSAGPFPAGKAGGDYGAATSFPAPASPVTQITNSSCHGSGAFTGQEHCSLHCQQAGADSWMLEMLEQPFAQADPPMLSLMSWSSTNAEVVTVCRRGWRWGILHPSSNTAGKRICQKPIVFSTKHAAGRALLLYIKRKTVRKLKIHSFLSYLNSSILALAFFTSKCSNLYWSQNIKHPEISVSKKTAFWNHFSFCATKTNVEHQATKLSRTGAEDKQEPVPHKAWLPCRISLEA